MMEKGQYNGGWSVPRLMSEPRWSIPDRGLAKNHSKVMVLAKPSTTAAAAGETRVFLI